MQHHHHFRVASSKCLTIYIYIYIYIFCDVHFNLTIIVCHCPEKGRLIASHVVPRERSKGLVTKSFTLNVQPFYQRTTSVDQREFQFYKCVKPKAVTMRNTALTDSPWSTLASLDAMHKGHLLYLQKNIGYTH